jgi:putative ABC transport system permease protein
MGEVMFQLRQAMRRLRRAPGYALAFVLTLGLAIGVNSAVFSVVNGVLLKPLPFQDADRILYLKQPVEAVGVENVRFSFMEIDDYREGSSSVEQFVEFGDWDFTVVADNEPHRAVGGLVTSNFFDVLGMHPAQGRLLNASDDAEGAEPVVLLTDAYWTRTFGRDPSVIGTTLDLTGTTAPVVTRIVGVLEPGLHYTGSRRPDFYVNYAVNDHYVGAAMRDRRDHRMTDVFARMAQGVDIASTQAELAAIATRMHAEYPDVYRPEAGYGLEAVRWSEELTRNGRGTFLVLMATVGVVLLLALANVVNLTLTRLIRKENELSTRAALGAKGSTLRLELMAEHALLGLGGGALGVVLAFLSRNALAAYAARFTVRAQEVGVDWTVFLATLGGGVVVTAVLAWLPGLPIQPGMSRVASAQSRATGTRWQKRVQRGLVVTQLSLSFTLLVGAGLLVRSLLALTSVDPGFRTEQVLTFRTPAGNFGALPGDDEMFKQLLAEVGSHPGVRSAAVASWVPLAAQAPLAIGIRVDGQVDDSQRPYLTAVNNVSPGYFETLGIPLLSGRYIDDSDRDESRDVVVINRSMAEAHFGDTDPIGRRISFSMGDGRNWSRDYDIVGVVADSREYGIEEEGVHTFYRSADQSTWGPAVLVATSGEPSALGPVVRESLRRLQPSRAIEQMQTLEVLREADVAPSRLNATLFGSFAVLALLIAAVGVLGTLAFSVSQRVREFGIRMAVGADQGTVLRSVLGEGVLLVVAALVLGAAASATLGRFLAGLLYQVGPSDPVSMVMAAAVLGVVALGAALLPAVRATRIDPSEALRGE